MSNTIIKFGTIKSTLKSIYDCIISEHKYYQQNKVEHFTLLCLNKENEIIYNKIISSGTEYFCPVNPLRIIDIVKHIGKVNYIITCHNHPSCILIPSKADIEQNKLVKNLLYKNFEDNIVLYDDIIIDNTNRLYSNDTLKKVVEFY